MKTGKPVVDDRKRLPHELLGQFHRKIDDLRRRLDDGTLYFQRTMNNLQLAIEDRFSPELDFTIRVKRSKSELRPPEYNLQSEVQQWLDDGQKNGDVSGDTIYNHLKNNNKLASCLNLQDGLAIQDKGVAVFRKLFVRKTVFLWGSVNKRHSSSMIVPFLWVCDDVEVIVAWRWLYERFNHNNPALLFSK